MRQAKAILLNHKRGTAPGLESWDLDRWECVSDLGARCLRIDRDRGEPRGSAPPTPPCVRVRTRRFESALTRLEQGGETERSGVLPAGCLKTGPRYNIDLRADAKLTAR